MRTLFVHTPLEPQLGADVWVHVQIMRLLDRTTHEVHIAYAPGPLGRPTPLERQLEGLGDVERFPLDAGPQRPEGRSLRAAARLARESGRWLVSLAKLARYTRRHRIDVIHTCDRPRDAMAAVVLGKVCRVPSIVHVHVAHGEWMSWQRRWSIAHADHRIAVSEFIRGSLIAAGSRADRTHTILNGADPQRSIPDPRAATVREGLGIPPEAVVVLTVCRLFEAKGVVELVEAFAAAGTGEAFLLIAGQDGSSTQHYLQRVQSRIAELGIGDRVRLLGWRDDVQALMTTADVFAMPSTEEPCALVYLEAMALGLPVVALDNGGTPELVVDGEQGLLSAHGDAPALAENLGCLVHDGELRARMGASGRARAAEQFTTERQASAVAALYRRCIVKKSIGQQLKEGAA